MLLNKLFYSAGNAVFTPSRWTKVAPPMRYWATGLVLHNILGQSYLQSDALEDCLSLSGAGPVFFFRQHVQSRSIEIEMWLLLQ